MMMMIFSMYGTSQHHHRSIDIFLTYFNNKQRVGVGIPSTSPMAKKQMNKQNKKPLDTQQEQHDLFSNQTSHNEEETQRESKSERERVNQR